MRDGRQTGGVLGISLLAGLLVMSPGTRPARAQAEADAALRDRVLQLVERLNDPKPEARDEAQTRLMKLGAKILPLLPESAGADRDRNARLDRIRASLKEVGE